MPDFWRDSGYCLLNRRGDGRLAVSDDFLRAYLDRPEMRPVAESCDAERALHAALSADPRLAVAPERIAALADADARDNYRVWLDFRDRLLAAGTIEDCYRGFFAGDAPPPPPLFVDHLVHAALRGILDGAGPMEARAGELLFRRQRVTIQDGAILAADAATVEMLAVDGGLGALGRLAAEAGTPLRPVELDVLNAENAESYWARAERYDTVIDLTFGRAGLDALCRVLEAWVLHFTGAAVSIQPVATIRDEHWVWHVGLDAEASALLNDLYNGVEIEEARLERLLSLFRLEFADPSLMLPRLRGRPVYMAMMMTPDRSLRIKPQNLLVNLPLATPA